MRQGREPRLSPRLVDHHEQLTQLTDLVTGIGDTLREHTDTWPGSPSPRPPRPPDRYRPGPPPWWKLAAADRQEPIARLRAWVQQVYQPGCGLSSRPTAWRSNATSFRPSELTRACRSLEHRLDREIEIE